MISCSKYVVDSYGCVDYTSASSDCDKVGKCRDLGYGVSSYEIQNGCCEFFGSNDCSGDVIQTASDKKTPCLEIDAAGLEDTLHSVRCYY